MWMSTVTEWWWAEMKVPVDQRAPGLLPKFLPCKPSGRKGWCGVEISVVVSILKSEMDRFVKEGELMCSKISCWRVDGASRRRWSVVDSVGVGSVDFEVLQLRYLGKSLTVGTMFGLPGVHLSRDKSIGSVTSRAQCPMPGLHQRRCLMSSEPGAAYIEFYRKKKEDACGMTGGVHDKSGRWIMDVRARVVMSS